MQVFTCIMFARFKRQGRTVHAHGIECHRAGARPHKRTTRCVLPRHRRTTPRGIEPLLQLCGPPDAREKPCTRWQHLLRHPGAWNSPCGHSVSAPISWHVCRFRQHSLGLATYCAVAVWNDLREQRNQENRTALRFRPGVPLFAVCGAPSILSGATLNAVPDSRRKPPLAFR